MAIQPRVHRFHHRHGASNMHHWRKGGAVSLFNFTKEAGGRLKARFKHHRSKVMVHKPKKGGAVAMFEPVRQGVINLSTPAAANLAHKVVDAESGPTLLADGAQQRKTAQKRVLSAIHDQFNKRGKR